MPSGRMAEPEKPEDFDFFEAEGMRLYVQRTLLECGDEIEFLIPHVGRFAVRVTAGPPAEEPRADG